jgi:hypothetical protein
MTQPDQSDSPELCRGTVGDTCPLGCYHVPYENLY